MKKSFAFTVFFMASVICYCQCPMVFVKKTFSQAEYYTSTKDSLKLIKTTYSTNSIEITKNTYNEKGDIFSATGNLVSGERYTGFIKEYECKKVGVYTKYLLTTNDGRTDDTWIVYVKPNGDIFEASLLSVKNGMCLTFR